MLTKFNRNFVFTVYPEYLAGVDTAPPFQRENAEGTVYRFKNPTTIEFSIIRSINTSQSSGSFRIYNLGQETRDAIYKDNFKPQYLRVMTFEAGYGDVIPMLFNGFILEAKSYRSEGSVNFITEIDAYDYAGFGVINSFSNFTLTAQDGSSPNHVINRLVQNLKDYKVTVGAVSDFGNTNRTRGRTILGPTWEALQIETGNLAYTDNGKIYALKNQDLYLGEIEVIDAATGLLSTPKKRDQFLTLEILFEPRISVGQRIVLASRAAAKYNGEYKVVAVEHFGVISDAVGGKCKTILTLYISDRKFVVLPEGVLG